MLYITVYLCYMYVAIYATLHSGGNKEYLYLFICYTNFQPFIEFQYGYADAGSGYPSYLFSILVPVFLLTES